MDTYKSENIIMSFNARINPTDKNVPDCMCILALSSNHLFVIEDNFDGTFFDHYIIDINMIDKIDVYEDEKFIDGHGYMGGAFDYDNTYKGGLVFNILKELVRPRGRGDSHRAKIRTLYIDVTYYDDHYSLRHLYFDEYDILPKDLIKKFEELKNSRKNI